MHRISKEVSLKALLDLLSKSTNVELIRILSRVGKILHSSKNIESAQTELMNLYSSQKMKTDLLIDKAANAPTVLFHRCSLKLIDELLRIQPIETGMKIHTRESVTSYTWNGYVLLPSGLVADYSLVDNLFLLANTLVYHLEGEKPPIKMETYSEKNKLFYSRLDVDGSASVGRAYMYYHQGLSQKLETIGIDIEEYLQAVFSLCAHLENNQFIEIELPQSINKLPSKFQKILSDYLPKLAFKLQSYDWDFKNVQQNLHKLYFNDFFCCQKPLIEIHSRYYCLQAKFLWAALADLPFYLLLDACKKDSSKVKHLGGLWGKAFENSFGQLCSRVFGEENCINYTCKSNYKSLNIKKDEHSIGDRFVFIKEDVRLIFEFKGALPTNEIKLGDRDKAISKFIDLKNEEGIPQLVRDAYIYREEESYEGLLFIILICRGPIPLTTDFDSDLRHYLSKRRDYNKYLENKLNMPLIYLDAIAAELIFSAIIQGIPVMEILPDLCGVSPSKILPMIKEKVEKYSYRFSFHPLYSEEVKKISGTARSMFSDFEMV